MTNPKKKFTIVHYGNTVVTCALCHERIYGKRSLRTCSNCGRKVCKSCRDEQDRCHLCLPPTDYLDYDHRPF